MNRTRIPLTPPGAHLKELLDGWGITQYRLAKATGIPHSRITAIVHGRRGFTPDTALRIGKAFGMAPEFWLNLQQHYDVETAREELGKTLESVQPFELCVTA